MSGLPRRLQGNLYRRKYVLELLQSASLWRSNMPIDIVFESFEQSSVHNTPVHVFITDPELVTLNNKVYSSIRDQ